MSLILQSSPDGCSNTWRLGSHEDPGWFDTSGALTAGRFTLATVFRLHWRLPPDPPDGIYNVLHAVTIGRASQSGKTDIEQLVQIKDAGLHVTCRFVNSSGYVERHTVALPGPWQHYQDRNLLLIYTSDTSEGDPRFLKTVNVLYDLDNLDQLQCIKHYFRTPLLSDIDFANWPDHRVICDHEQYNVPRDHVIVHGHGAMQTDSSTSFVIQRIWGSLGQTLDAFDSLHIGAFTQKTVPDQIGTVRAWYNCDCDSTVTKGPEIWAVCTGRYLHRNSLGIKLSTDAQYRDHAHK